MTLQLQAVETRADLIAAKAGGRRLMEVMGVSGDEKYSWDPNDRAQVQAAEEMFNRLTGQGYLAFRLTAEDDRGEQLTVFDPDAERVIFVPRMQGG